ncbi:MAG: two-component system sensor histidine kinase RppB [Oculatellaceae cyanobacterium bins.114]|nr:two-component system sensor histidine kinase RppB [Oculatellaceae cyanobacterium bins.114]
MNRNKVFVLTRWRLAGLYVGTMGVILALSGFCFYKAIAHNQWQSLNRKLASVAGTLHDGIEPALQQPGEVTPITSHFLPGLVCLNGASCVAQVNSAERHVTGLVQDNYYVRFISSTGTLLATAGQQPVGLPATISSSELETVQASDGTRYRQIVLQLKIEGYRPWGYIQVGQSLEEYEIQLNRMRWMLGLGMPTVMLFIGMTGWWLSGLAMKPVYQSYRQIQQFTADAAHELRTPLAAIQSTVEFSLDEPDLTEAEAKDTLRTIERQSKRLTQLVQDLLLLSRIDLQIVPAKQSSCCLNRLIEDLVDEFLALATASQIELKTKIETSELLFVLGNEEQLYRLFANLIINAIQYTAPGGKVTIHLQKEDNHALFYVQDTGIGIPLKEQSRIFDRFYRIHSDRSRHTGGSGLGLAIAQAIAQTYQGNIQVQSETDKGSTFTVRLPLKLPQGKSGEVLKNELS